MDVILSSLQDLNQGLSHRIHASWPVILHHTLQTMCTLNLLIPVRERNEKQLAKEYARRVQLETQLGAVTSHHSAASLKKTQAMESLKVVSEQSSIAEAQASR